MLVSPVMKEKDFLSAAVISKQSMTARCLNNINAKLVEDSRDNCALSLFNLAVNRVFPLIDEEEVELDNKLMKKLLIEQQQRMYAY